MRDGGRTSDTMRPFWPVRSRAQAGVLAATALTVLVITFLAAVMVGLAVRSPTAAVRQSIEAGPAAAVSLALQASLSEDGDAQDSVVRATIAKSFAGTAVTVDRTAYVASAALTTSGRSVLALAGDDAVEARATLAAGSWPAAAGEVAVDRELAAALDLAPGSALTVAGADGPVTLRVTGVWRATHPDASAWLGITAGTGGTDGRVIVAPDILPTVSTSPAAQWVVTPDARRTTAAQLPALRTAFTHIADTLTEKPNAASSPFAGLGGAAATVADMQQSVGALSAVVPVPLAVLAVCSAIALILLAQLLARSRLTETRLLRARGATVEDLLRVGAVESAVVALAGAVLGAVAAQAVLLGQVGAPGGWPTGVLEVALPPLVVVIVAVAAALLITGLSARSATGAPGAVEAGRGRTAVSAGLAVLAVVAAGVTLWRFLSFGSPVAADGRVDPVGVIAPAAVLCAIAMLGLLLFGPAAAAVEAVAARGRGVGAVLPARQVGRGLALFAAPVALVVLTVGAATFSAGYVGTWSGFLHDSSRLVNGSDVRVALGVEGSTRGPGDATGAASLAKDPSVSAAAPALTTDADFGQGTITLVSVDARRLPELTRVGAYMFDAPTVARQLTAGAGLRGVALPRGASEVTAQAGVVVPATPGAPAATPPMLKLTFWVSDAAGELIPLPAATTMSTSTSVRDGAPGTFHAALPVGGPWTLVAVDTHLDTGAAATAAEVSIRSLATRTGGTSTPLAIPDAQQWQPATKAFGAPFSLEPLTGGTGGIGYRAALVPPGADNAVRLMPAGGGKVPAVFTQAAAAASSLTAGESVSVEGTWVDVDATVASVVAAVPGTNEQTAVLVDLRALDDQVLRTSPNAPRLGSVWLATDRPDAVAAAVQRAAGADAVVSTASGSFVARFMASAIASLWLGTAGCAALALVALGAAVAALLKRRRGEVIVLRAVGMSGRQQAASRRLEVIGVVAAAAVFGLAGGVAVFLLAGNALARLSVVTAPSTLAVQGQVDVVGLLAALAAVGVAIALVLWFYGSRVRRQVADTAYREETR
ncbi:hypothetical protein [Leifsonia poae]|uniref:ABC3 transporter permease protein domain-containing protein n=1 Tax=Leifsonia poae TaxID=110933 RepID=A0A9W6H6M1_9MICO|nr:hypothetical protein [Leifsonia poae]GLJ74915.1 hypothetical protein GCM10017584_04880 [Leifsonia poae]